MDERLVLDLQHATEYPHLPDEEDFRRWVLAALPDEGSYELTIRLVDEAESQELNASYRGKDRPTNVLSFPFEAPEHITLPLLGDLVICAPLMAEEARQQGKKEDAHWAHLTIHGVLHLRGYDHIDSEEAEEMEALEISLLESLGIPDPYKE